MVLFNISLLNSATILLALSSETIQFELFCTFYKNIFISIASALISLLKNLIVIFIVSLGLLSVEYQS